MNSIAVSFMVCPWNLKRRTNVQRMIRQLQQEGGLHAINRIDAIRGQTVWQTAKRAWMAGLKSGASYVAVLQDDIGLCLDFVAGLKAVTAICPNDIVQLFSMRNTCELAAGNSWVQIKSFCWGQSTIMSAKTCGRMLVWSAKNIRADSPHDDCRVALYSHETNEARIMLAVPNLVEHLWPAESEMGHGFNPNRASKHHIGFDRSALSIDWSIGAENPPVLRISPSKIAADMMLSK